MHRVINSLAELLMRTCHLYLGSQLSESYSHTLWAELSEEEVTEDILRV